MDTKWPAASGASVHHRGFAPPSGRPRPRAATPSGVQTVVDATCDDRGPERRLSVHAVLLRRGIAERIRRAVAAFQPDLVRRVTARERHVECREFDAAVCAGVPWLGPPESRLDRIAGPRSSRANS